LPSRNGPGLDDYWSWNALNVIASASWRRLLGSGPLTRAANELVAGEIAEKVVMCAGLLDRIE